MGLPRALPVGLGALAVASTSAVLAFDIILAITLFPSSSITKANIVFIIAAGFGVTDVFALIFLLSRQTRYRNGAHVRDLGIGKRHTYLLAGLSAVFAVLQAVASAVALGMVESKVDSLPQKTYAISTKTLVIIAFAVWAGSLVLQAIFLICIVIVQRGDYQAQIQTYQSESLPQIQTQMQKPARPRAQSAPETPAREKKSIDSTTTPPSGRSSISQVVRPMNSKTRLIPGHQKCLTTHSRPPSIDSAHHESVLPIEEGFDSWDTSSVDPHSMQVVESVSPTPPRFLETIPASPTGSRSPSPGCPLDLEPPKLRKRSRSFSPSTSTFKDAPKAVRSNSPAITPAEANIHPLFRTDSPTPPPAATPGTMVTAAPGAGLLISDRQSIRSIHRMRSGSLPSSPLLHSSSLDSFKRTMEKEEKRDVEREQEVEDDIERKLTPPIPDWILGAGARERLSSGYNSRKQPPIGLGVVGEAL